MRSRQSMIGHSWDCRYKYPSCDAICVTYNRVRVCFECYRTNTYGIEICLCVKKDDPPNLIRTHLIADANASACITDQVIPPDAVFHYIPDDFRHCRDKKVCPRRGGYCQCQGIIKHPQCTNLVYNNSIICAKCTDVNKCSYLHCGGIVTTRAHTINQSMQLCEDHYVFTCITCKRQKVEYDYCTQCRECDVATNSIVCCGAVHKPHSLTYPRKNVDCIHCVDCNCSPAGRNHHIYDTYWRLIQTAYIWKLYKTVAASPARRKVSFATALMLHLSWRGGVIAYMLEAGESACCAYILSQYDSAAMALVRVRWLPQPLRLMILGYV